MSVETETVPNDTAPRGVLRLFSWTGALPLALFLVVHLAVCGAALFGPGSFAAAVDALDGVPGVRVLEVVVVLAPLVFHAMVGVWLVATRRTLGPRPYGAAARTLLRASAIVALVFVAWHVWDLRVRAPAAGGAEYESLLSEHLSSTTWLASADPTWRGVPLVALAYLVGAAATVLHVAIGAWGWLHAHGRRAPAVRWSIAGIAAALALLAMTTVVAFATGARPLESDEPTPAEIRPPPPKCPP